MKTNLLSAPPAPDASNCFRLFLQAELGRRCARNSQYSLRAFAKFLATDHATMSQLLRGKRPLSERTILKLGTRLGLERAAIDGFIAEESRWRSEAAADVTSNEMQQLADDAARVIADWYHYAILELTRLENFEPDSRWIARVLGITTDEVNLALTRLLRLGLLEMAQRGYGSTCRVTPRQAWLISTEGRCSTSQTRCASSCSRRSRRCLPAAANTARPPWRYPQGDSPACSSELPDFAAS